jgi:hypothetical protein
MRIVNNLLGGVVLHCVTAAAMTRAAHSAQAGETRRACFWRACASRDQRWRLVELSTISGGRM